MSLSEASQAKGQGRFAWGRYSLLITQLGCRRFVVEDLHWDGERPWGPWPVWNGAVHGGIPLSIAAIGGIQPADLGGKPQPLVAHAGHLQPEMIVWSETGSIMAKVSMCAACAWTMNKCTYTLAIDV